MSNSLLDFDLKTLKLPRWLTLGTPADAGAAGLRAKYPPVAMDMDSTHLTLVRLAKEARSDKPWALTSYDVVEVSGDLLEAEAFRVRFKSADRFRALVAGALTKEGVRTNAISLVLPDHLARVALLPFEELPRTRRELIEMIRWKMKKAVPFKVEEAAVDYQVMSADPSAGQLGHMVLAVLIPQAIIEEHEAVFQPLGIHAGLVDLSSFSLVHLYRPVIDNDVPAGDFMVLNVTGAFFTVMVFRDGRMIFYRCKTFAFGHEQDAGSDERLIRREIQASLLYYQERLAGRELARIYLRVVDQDLDQIAGMFDEAPAATRPEPFDLSRVVGLTGRFAAAGDERSREIMMRAAPAVGAALGRHA